MNIEFLKIYEEININHGMELYPGDFILWDYSTMNEIDGVLPMIRITEVDGIGPSDMIAYTYIFDNGRSNQVLKYSNFIDNALRYYSHRLFRPLLKE